MRPLPPQLVTRLADGGAGLAVLVVRLGAMGDVLRTVPALRVLRRALPRAHVSWFVDDVWVPLLEGHPDLDRLVALPRRAWRRDARSIRTWPALARALHALRAELRASPPALALDVHGTLRSGLALVLGGAPVRLGFDGHWQKEGNRLFTTHRVAAGPRRTSRVERALALVRALGVATPAALPACALELPRRGAPAAAAIRGELGYAERGYLVINPGASARQAYKKPPAALLGAAATAAHRAGVPSLVVWGPGEREDAERVVTAAGGPARLAPPTDLATLAALVATARAFAGGDSGPMHLACAVGCPVVALYGPTDPVVNAPWGVPHRTVSPAHSYSGRKREDRQARFDAIDRDAVERAVETLLRERVTAG